MQDILKATDRLMNLLTEECSSKSSELKSDPVKIWMINNLAVHLIHDNEKTTLRGLSGEVIMHEQDYDKLYNLGLLK